MGEMNAIGAGLVLVIFAVIVAIVGLHLEDLRDVYKNALRRK